MRYFLSSCLNVSGGSDSLSSTGKAFHCLMALKLIFRHRFVVSWNV